jgi:hypothetical protein
MRIYDKQKPSKTLAAKPQWARALTHLPQHVCCCVFVHHKHNISSHNIFQRVEHSHTTTNKPCRLLLLLLLLTAIAATAAAAVSSSGGCASGVGQAEAQLVGCCCCCGVCWLALTVVPGGLCIVAGCSRDRL